MKRVLLHICCGPCAIYPFQALEKDGFSVEGFFYNPNIQPQSEYLKRKEAVKSLLDIFGFKVNFTDYRQDDYAKSIRLSKDKNDRCRSCFSLRLANTQRFASENKFDFFTTTLLVSPYQDQEMIKQIGSQISQGSAAQFLFYDFRPGYRCGHAKAKELNLYCQKYCGCLASLKERDQEKNQRKINAQSGIR